MIYGYYLLAEGLHNNDFSVVLMSHLNAIVTCLPFTNPFWIVITVVHLAHNVVHGALFLHICLLLQLYDINQMQAHCPTNIRLRIVYSLQMTQVKHVYRHSLISISGS